MYNSQTCVEATICPGTVSRRPIQAMVRDSEPLRSVHEILGHKSIQTTMVYARLNYEAVERPIQTIDSALAELAGVNHD